MNEESKKRETGFDLSAIFPILNWLPRYKRQDLVGDLLAGSIVAIMLVPQSMAYAILAGLPPQVGLYASILPLILYAVFGSSRVLAVGPVAMVSLLTLSGVGALAESGTAEFIALVLLVALMTGVIQILMGAARLGFLVNFLSHPVLVGFTSAAAVVIGTSQLKHIFGVKLPLTEHPYQVFSELIALVPEIAPATLLIGAGSVALLFFFKYLLGKILMRLGMNEGSIGPIIKSGALFAVVLSALVVWLLGLDSSSGVRVVGSIPAGLPSFGLPVIEGSKVIALLPIALIISFVGFTESISIATILASKKRQKIDPNQELVALGASNIGAAFTGGYPVTGGISRSAMNFAAGANTGVASILTAFIIIATLLFLTPLFYYLPLATLGAIVIVAVAGLFDLRSFVRIWKYNKKDAAALLATFFGVFIFSIELGIAIGVFLSLLLYLYRTSIPHVAVVGRVGDTEHFRNVLRHEVSTCPDTIAIRIDESLYFANAGALEHHMLDAAADDKDLKNIILICSAVNFIDSSALDTLISTIEELRAGGVDVYLAEVKGPVMDQLEKVDFLEFFGENNVFLSTHQAFEQCGCEGS